MAGRQPPPPSPTYFHVFPPLSSPSWAAAASTRPLPPGAAPPGGPQPSFPGAGGRPLLQPPGGGLALGAASAFPGAGGRPLLQPPGDGLALGAASAFSTAGGLALGAAPAPHSAGAQPLPGVELSAATASMAAALTTAGTTTPPGAAVGPEGAAAGDAPAVAAAGLGSLLPSGDAALPADPLPEPAGGSLAAALVAARAAAAEGQARVRAAALLWERERDAADALARRIAEAEQLLAPPASHDAGATSSASSGRRVSHTAVLWHDPADPLVAQLHYQAGGV
jgi:hypothetical protein